MRLFIAEKPSLGRAIAAELGVTQNNPTFQICGSDTVTWCFGHILEQYDPQDYDDNLRIWRRRDLPIIPKEWKLRPKESALTQLQVINHLLSEAEMVVHAGDPDREGQLLVDEVLEHFNYHGPVQRIWLASLDSRSIQKALATLKDNRDYANLRDAARARSQADWLIGMNASRAMTIFGRETGHTDGVLSLGRVQTPTLALVVQRDREIKAFVPVDYLILQASLQNDAGSFSATFKPSDTQTGLDSEGRLVDASIAQGIVDSVRGQTGIITSVTREKKKKPVPLPHCLSSLQKAASSKFGMTAQQVLDTAQSLYEKKLTTYPRTDCRYLPEEQFSDASRLITALSGVSGLEAMTAKADSALRGPVWDTKKITAHHAIIPTAAFAGNGFDRLPESEKKLMSLVCCKLLCAVAAPHVYEAVTATFTCAGNTFTAKGKTILTPGWKELDRRFKASFKTDADDTAPEPARELPEITEGQTFDKVTAAVTEHFTAPPKSYTEDTLLSAMERAGADDLPEDAERQGLGTPATRASILEKLVQMGFVERRGKQLLPTKDGHNLACVLPEVLTSPQLTAQWETELTAIAKGQADPEGFMQDIAEMTRGLIANYSQISEDAQKLFQTERVVIGKCPRCGESVYEGKKNYYCGNRSCQFVMWKNDRFFEERGKAFTPKIAAALLKDGKAKVKGLRSMKTGKTYDGTVLLADTGGKYVNYRVEQRGKN